MNIEQIARICHEANKAYCETIGDHSQEHWEKAAEWQRNSAMMGVKFALDHPDAPASTQHEAWLAEKRLDGWAYSPVKDPDKKLHPCFVPYIELPAEQRLKDYLFKAIVGAFVMATHASEV